MGRPTRAMSRLYLDIDGVLNVAHLRTACDDWDDWQRVPVGYAPVVTSPVMLASLFALPVDEIVWATTWESDADRLFAAALGITRGLRHLPLADGWKGQAIVDDLRHRPVDRFVWIDDAEADQPNRDWITARVAASGLTVRPHPGQGVTREHLAAIERFLTTPP